MVFYSKLNKSSSPHMCSMEMVCGTSSHGENVYGFSLLPSIWNLSTSE